MTGAAEPCRSGARLSDGVRVAVPLCGLGRHSRELHWTLANPWWLGPTKPYFRHGLTRQLRFAWSQPGAVGGLLLDEPLDLSGPDTTLDLRIVTDPALHPTRLAVRLTDADGTSWTAPDVVLRRMPGRGGLVAVWARMVRTGLSDAPADLDRAGITGVDLVARSGTGRVWLLDASARRPGLTPAPGTRLPSIRIGKATVREGDAGGEAVAEVPYTVVGDVTTPGRFAVAIQQNTFGRRTPNRFVVVTVSPGGTSGVIEVPYESDRLDDRALMQQQVIGVPLTGLAMGDYFGRALIRDDDPTPRLRFGAKRQWIRYGGRMVFVARLTAPVDYTVYSRLSGRVLDRFRPLRVADVPDWWARRHIVDAAPDRSALARWITDEHIRIKPGSVRGTFAVPTRKHPPHPRRKALTLRMTSPQLDDPIRTTARVR